MQFPSLGKIRGGTCGRNILIERDIPKVRDFGGGVQIREAAAKSNQALRQLAPDIQWNESFVTADKTFLCVSG